MLVMFLSVETLFANVIMLLKACPCGFVPYFINNKNAMRCNNFDDLPHLSFNIFGGLYITQ